MAQRIRPHAFEPQRAGAGNRAKKCVQVGGSRKATECSGAAYGHAESSRTGRGQVVGRPSESHRAAVTDRVIPEAASVTFISLKDLVNSSAKPTKSATVVPEKHSRMNDPRSGSGTMYKKR